MAKMRTKGVSKKKQGKAANPEDASATNVFPEPRTYKRGIGSAYAFAVQTLMSQADKISGSKNGFLGVDKVELDPTEYQKGSLLPKGFEPRKKKNEE